MRQLNYNIIVYISVYNIKNLQNYKSTLDLKFKIQQAHKTECKAEESRISDFRTERGLI